MLSKQIPHDLKSFHDIGDLYDKSSIFREFKNKYRNHGSVANSEIDNYELATVVG